jgi:hypothetical protein
MGPILRSIQSTNVRPSHNSAAIVLLIACAGGAARVRLRSVLALAAMHRALFVCAFFSSFVSHFAHQPLHTHGPVLADIFYGKKRWFLFAPQAQPRFNPDKSTLDWLLNVYPSMRACIGNKCDASCVESIDYPLECVLQPGQMIFVPDQWWHSTLNIGETVFMANFL